MDAISGEIPVLEIKLLDARNAYYAGEPILSDPEYDALSDRLTALCKESPVLKDIGHDVAAHGKKIKHLMMMGSQDKAQDEAEFAEWFNKQPHGTYFVVQHKLDGASLELQYADGKLRCAVTRGDGLEGDDITANAQTIKGIPALLQRAFTGSVRGEVLVLHDDFEKHFQGKANCRNAAVGAMKKPNSLQAKYLTFIAYDVSHVEEISTEAHKIEYLSGQGFRVPEGSLVTDNLDLIQALRSHTAEMRGDLPYDLDGLVIKSNGIDRDDERLPRPTRQIAYKFPLEEAATVLRDVAWQQSGKTFTPVATVDPVKLAGATVMHASLVHLGNIRTLGLAIGSTVLMTRRGEVIPKIEKCVLTPIGAAQIEPPAYCPTCGGLCQMVGVSWECINKECLARVEHQVASWLATLKIKGIGPATINHLCGLHLVRSISDLYTLTPEMIFALVGPSGSMLGVIEAKNVVDAIHSKTEIALAQLIAGYDIDGIGVSTIACIIASGYKTLERIMTASVAELSSIAGIGEITAQAVLGGIKDNIRDMTTLTSSGAVRVLAEITEGALLGQTFCFTGPLTTMSRDEAELQVKAAGGTAKSSVVKGLTYLVTNDPHSGSSKNKKAEAQGTLVIDEAKFLTLLRGIS